MARQLLQSTPASVPIVATARSDVQGTREKLLSELELSQKQTERFHVFPCDVLKEESIADLAGQCKEQFNDQSKNKEAHLRLGFMIPGIMVPEKAPDKIEYETALQMLEMNLLAPMMLIKHFYGFLPKKSIELEEIDGLPKSAVLALMSARVGSISDNKLGGWYSYRSSKAGVNQLAKSTDIHVKMQSGGNAMCLALHPGTVKTELSRAFWKSTAEKKLFSPEFSAEKLVEVVKDVGEAGRGKCWDWAGKEVLP